ncbi:MAG: hypothetical protein M5U34_00615 [Chloroflexi bacterium]|nr:hypothetical protein [Chloroflexota bacterium]
MSRNVGIKIGWAGLSSSPIAYGILCLLSLASDVGRPFPGFFTYYNNIYTQMDVEWNIPSWWWDDTGNRPRLDDLLLQVNQTPFAGIQRPVAEAPLYAAVWNQGQTDVTITVKRSDQIITFTTRSNASPGRSTSTSCCCRLSSAPVIGCWLLFYTAPLRVRKNNVWWCLFYVPLPFWRRP